MSARTVLVMAGGTGGHVFPALAVARELAARGWKVVWLGTRQGIEARLVPAAGFPVEWIRFSGLRGKGALRALLLPLNLLVALFQALRAVLRHRPDVVLGMGGFAAFPGGLMASLMARPLVIHEQNSVAGLTNRVLALLADRVLAAFPGAFEGSRLPAPRRVELAGNPVRPEIAALPEPAQRYAAASGPLRLLVVGGSLGARALNTTVPAALARLPEAARPAVTHQTGRDEEAVTREAYRQAGVAARVQPFIDDMAQAYGDADLVVCRAGALTIAELTAAGVASILVPFPHAVDDHQTGNARFLSEQGAALLEPQTGFTAERLAGLLADLSRERLAAMAMKARALARPEATATVAGICAEAAG